VITAYKFTDRFKKQFAKLPPELQAAGKAVFLDLLKDPHPKSLRFHSLSGTNPKLYTVDLTGNKSYKISMEINGTIATLRRVATHKEIDRLP
jgi:hypothetical protein